MAVEPKPKTRPIWSESGDATEPSDAKKTLGWVQEIPPHQTFNWIHNNLARFASHVNESGIPEWDAITSYDIDALAKGSDGTVYVSLTNGNVANDPISTPTEWQIAFAPSTFATGVASDSGFDGDALPYLTILIDNSAGPFTIGGVAYTNAQLTIIRDNLLAAWVAALET